MLILYVKKLTFRWEVVTKKLRVVLSAYRVSSESDRRSWVVQRRHVSYEAGMPSMMPHGGLAARRAGQVLRPPDHLRLGLSHYSYSYMDLNTLC